MTLQTGKPIPAGSPAVDHGSRPAMPVVPSQGEASGADRLLTAEDRAVIDRCVERQPVLMMRGQHEGYYIHSDVTDLLNIIARLSTALSASGPAGVDAIAVPRSTLKTAASVIRAFSPKSAALTVIDAALSAPGSEAVK